MNKKILESGFILAASLILTSAVNKPTSSGAPSASSGAPSEQTCAMSNCHDDNSLNSGTAKLTVEVGEFGGNKTKGFPLKIKITDAGKVRFGFQVTALDANNKKIGQFIITDVDRTQTLGGNNSFPDRQYLTYTYLGTLANNGEAIWEANWVPDDLDLAKPGKVWFYIAALSGNNDGQDKGDFTYTATATKSWETTLKNDNLKPESKISLSLVKSDLTIINSQFKYIKTISITDIFGKLILTKTINSADETAEIKLPELSKGVVIVTIQTSTETITKKLFATHD